ncbi:MAG: hypothetical protein IKS45_00560, partial [Thermoguttaceae bacterium]|nr:hypothetical protein [Thermoguttaceae bacterium]
MNKYILCLLAVLSNFCVTTFAAEPSQASSIHVAIYGDSGADGFKLFPPLLKDVQNIQMEVLNGQQIRDGALDKFDLIILPGGSGSGNSRVHAVVFIVGNQFPV